MSTAIASPVKKQEQLDNIFTEQLKKVLEHFNDPLWLGKESALSAPYFLGEYLLEQAVADVADPQQRGEVLQKLIRETVESLPSFITIGKRDVQARELVKLYYLTERKKRMTGQQVADKLSISRGRVWEHLNVAVEQLGNLLLQKLCPTLRSELPPFNPNIVGRDEQIRICTEALQEKKMLGLIGQGGIGKTALGAFLSSNFASKSTFWFTFRLGLNDNLNSLLFAMGYFLQHQGSSNLWGQLISGENIEPEMALGLIRYDLQQIQESTILFCFDEVDLLRFEEVDAHGLIFSFFGRFKGCDIDLAYRPISLD